MALQITVTPGDAGAYRVKLTGALDKQMARKRLVSRRSDVDTATMCCFR